MLVLPRSAPSKALAACAAELLELLEAREKELGITPDPDIHRWMVVAGWLQAKSSHALPVLACCGTAMSRGPWM